MAGPRAQARLGAVVRRRERGVSRGARAAALAAARGVAGWDEPFRTTLRRVRRAASTRRTPRSHAVREAVGRLEDYAAARPGLARTALKLHAATLPLAEFAAVIGNLRAARFGRDSAWRTTATVRRARRAPPHADPAAADARAGALGSAVRLDAQVLPHQQLGRDRGAPPGRRAAARRRTRSSSRSPPTSCSRPASPTCSSSGSSSLAHERRRPDVREDGAAASRPTRRATRRSARPVLATLVEHDRAYAQYLRRQVVLAQLAAVRGRDRLQHGLPHAARAAARASFKEFMEEWVLEQFLRSLDELGLEAPVVLGHLPRGARPLPPHGLRERLHLPRDGLVRLRRARAPTSAPGCARSIRASWRRVRPGLGAHHRALARGGSDVATTSPSTARAIVGVLRSVPARAVRRHAAAATRRRRSSTTAQRYIFCSRAVPLDLRAGARALRRPQGRRQARAGGRGAGQPDRAGATLFRPATTETWGKDAFARRLPWLGAECRDDSALRLSRGRHHRPAGARRRATSRWPRSPASCALRPGCAPRSMVRCGCFSADGPWTSG